MRSEGVQVARADFEAKGEDLRGEAITKRVA